MHKVRVIGLMGVATAALASPASRAGEAVGPTAGYVRLCDGYGPSFLAISGTGACIRVGGLVMAEVRGADPRYRLSETIRLPALGAGAAPSAVSSAPAAGVDALGRVEIDIRQQTEAGPLRAFIRVDGHATPFARP